MFVKPAKMSRKNRPETPHTGGMVSVLLSDGTEWQRERITWSCECSLCHVVTLAMTPEDYEKLPACWE